MRESKKTGLVTLLMTEPFLRASRDVITDISGNSISMSCSIHSAIHYCYFRNPNGTVYNIRPGISHSEATYVGAGFDAGECGIRFHRLAATDSGDWSCHVGLINHTGVEQRTAINVTIHDPMTVNQRMEGSQLVIETQVYNNSSLDYCRFVRIDGFGFSLENFPNNYTNLSSLSQGKCGIAIDRPSSVDRHPWTIVAKIKGQDKEISVVTQITCSGQGIITFLLPSAWVIVMVLIVTILLVCALMGTKNNREWTYRRASAIRNSFRRKTVAQNNDENTEKNVTASAA